MDTEKQANRLVGPRPLSEQDPTDGMNREQIRRFGRAQTRKEGVFTKPCLSRRTKKRRTVKKVGNATRNAARKAAR